MRRVELKLIINDGKSYAFGDFAAIGAVCLASVAQVFDEVEGAAELQAAEHGVGEDFEDLHLFRGECARSAIDDAERAETHTFTAERHAAIKADVGIAGHKWIVGKARIFFRIRHDERFGMLHGLSAKGKFARRFLRVEADARLEPLAALVDQGDRGDGSTADEGGGAGNVIEFLFGGGVENAVGAKKLEASCFVARCDDGGGHAERGASESPTRRE